MNNTHKLLLTFIKASGYEVEEVNHIQQPSDERTLIDCKEVTDYKVTKKGEGNKKCPFCNGRKGHHKFKTFVECSYCDGSGKIENL